MANTTINDETQPITTISVDETLEMSPELQMLDQSRRQLRRRWELASVLNFLRVFEPVIGKEAKMSAQEIETALIIPNHSLSLLHITLLKGIPPVNKNLSNPDAWVTILCKKLAEWWPWVAEGEAPLTAGKGEEVSRYKELDPIIRLSMLKALCELRTEQSDLMSYVNDALKQGMDISHFRADKISETRTGTSFWYDGNSVMGYRLYREVSKPQLMSKYRGKGCKDLPPTNIEWETLATNLEEFRKFSEELSSSSDVVEGSVYQTIETEVIPALEKLKKNQERILKRRQRQEALLNEYHSYVSVRTCRTRKPVKYTFDEYDRTIEEAIKVTREGKSRKVDRNGKKLHEDGIRDSDASNEDVSKDAYMEEGSQGSMEEEQNDDLQVEDSNTEEDSNNIDDTDNTDSDTSNSELEEVEHDTLDSQGENDHVSNVLKKKDGSESSSGYHSREPSTLRAKNRLRQRPTQNSALESSVISNSDDGSASDVSSEGDPSEVADSEDDMSS
ncbi:hypothetical protein RND81_03G126200 [Saponaria officinalis]|uniref:DDT domain-containing protein DDR4 n=1 Tax=Saponaria officinalis TaxID=3572 RepID=A0AAW1LZU8_SAPOF